MALGLVLASAAVVFGLGVAQKAPCAQNDWSDLRQYRRLCYTDIVPLLSTEQLAGGRLPFLDPCRPTAGQNCDEYPVLTMYTMRAADWVARDQAGPFFFTNAAFLAICAMVVVVATSLVAGNRALYVALAPTLLIYATVNWDLLAVALASLALLALARRRDGLAGALLGLGAAAKLYPALLVVPFAATRLRERHPKGAAAILAWSAGTWAVVNLPFAAAAPQAWLEFFRFNAERCPDFDSLWSIAFRWAGQEPCGHTGEIGALAIGAFLVIVSIVWAIKARRQPGFPRWALGFPVLAAFLLANKVYSPQYGLWLLPWFAVALPTPWAFAAFELADVAVFVTRFRWFLQLSVPDEGNSQAVFEIAVLVRAAVLVWCLIEWIRREHEPLPARMPAPWGHAETVPA